MAVGGGVIGALRVVLGADTAQFETGLKKGSQGLNKFAADAKLAAAAVATAMAAAATALGAAVQGKLAAFDQLAKSADKVGLPVEELIRLRHAAELAGVPVKTLDMAMQRFSRRVGEAAQGGGELKGILDQYNIAVTDSSGRMRPLTDIMGDLSDRMKETGSSQEQLRMAFKAFDSEGAALVNMMKNGSGAMREMMAEADALGLVIDGRTARAAEAFNDNLTRLKALLDGVLTQIAANLAPALAVLSGRLLAAAKDSDTMASAQSLLTTFLQGTSKVVGGLVVFFQRLAAELKSLAQAWELLKQGEFGAAWRVFQEGQTQTEAAFANMKAEIARFWEDVAAESEKRAPELGPRLAAPMVAAAGATQASAGNIKSSVAAIAPKASSAFDEAGRAAQQFGSSLENAFTSAVTGGQKLSDVAKNLLQDLARLAAQSAFKALLGPLFGGGGFAFAGLPGFASGGSFQVGGSGGIDSQLVAFKASPNERVTVTKPGQDMGGGGMVFSMPITISADGADPAQLSRLIGEVQRLKRELPDRVIAAVRDGKNRLIRDL